MELFSNCELYWWAWAEGGVDLITLEGAVMVILGFETGDGVNLGLITEISKFTRWPALGLTVVGDLLF